MGEGRGAELVAYSDLRFHVHAAQVDYMDIEKRTRISVPGHPKDKTQNRSPQQRPVNPPPSLPPPRAFCCDELTARTSRRPHPTPSLRLCGPPRLVFIPFRHRSYVFGVIWSFAYKLVGSDEEVRADRRGRRGE